MRKFLLMSVAALLMVACAPKEKSADSNEAAEEANEEKFDNKKDEKDAEFVSETVASNLGEIELAQLAASKSDNAQVKEVATMLAEDHNKLLTQLQAFASTKAISVPTEPRDDALKKVEDLK